MSLDEYRPTDAVTRHSTFITGGSEEAVDNKQPQFLVHLSQTERDELQKAFDRAVQKAGEAGAQVLRQENYSKLRSSSAVRGCNSSGRSTLDLVVPWGASQLDIHDSSLLVPMFQKAVKDTHEKWKKEMEVRMQEKLNFIDHTLGGEDFMQAAAKEAPTKKSKSSSQPRSLESIKQERSKLATKGEILALDNEVRSLQEKLKEMQKQLDIARDNLPLFLRQQTQRDIEEIGQQFSEILQQRQKEFRRALEGVRDAAAVAVADEVARVTGELEKQAATREQQGVRALLASQQVAKKANMSLVSDRDMREATLSHLSRLLDKVRSFGIDPASEEPVEAQVSRILHEKAQQDKADKKKGGLHQPPTSLLAADNSLGGEEANPQAGKLKAQHEAEVSALKAALAQKEEKLQAANRLASSASVEKVKLAQEVALLKKTALEAGADTGTQDQPSKPEASASAAAASVPGDQPELQELERQVQALQQDLARSRDENQALIAEARAKADEESERAAKLQEAAVMGEKLEILEAELRLVRDTDAQSEELVAALQEHAHTTAETLAKLRLALAESDEDRQEQKQLLEEKDSHARDLNDKLLALDLRLTDQQHALDRAREAAATIEQELAEKEEKVVEARAEAAQAQAMHAQLEAAVQDFEKALEDAQLEARSAEETLARERVVLRSLETKVEELQRVVEGEQDRVQEAVREASKLKAAVPSEEQTKAVRYASFRQGMIMGEANAKANSARECQDLLMSAVSQVHKAANDALAAEFSRVMQSTCALPRSASPLPAPDAGSFPGLRAGKHGHGEEDADMVAHVLAQASAAGTALSRELLAVAREICESKTTVASERREDESPVGEDGFVCPVCAQRALLEFEERGVETEPHVETVERDMATSAVDLTCQGSTSISSSTKVKVASDGTTTRVSSNTKSAHACAPAGTASSLCTVSVQTLISGEDQPYYRRRLAGSEEEWIRCRRFRRQGRFATARIETQAAGASSKQMTRPSDDDIAEARDCAGAASDSQGGPGVKSVPSQDHPDMLLSLSDDDFIDRTPSAFVSHKLELMQDAIRTLSPQQMMPGDDDFVGLGDVPTLDGGAAGERWLDQEGPDEPWVRLGARHVRRHAPMAGPVQCKMVLGDLKTRKCQCVREDDRIGANVIRVDRLLVPVGKSAASAPPPLLPSRAVKLEKSAGDPRPLSAISPHKIRRPHTARGAPPGADFAQMTCNLPAPGATDVGDVYGDAGHRACWRTRGVRRGPKGTDVSFLESAAATAPFLARRASTGSSAGIATGAAEPMVNSRKLSRTFHSPMMPWTPAPGPTPLLHSPKEQLDHRFLPQRRPRTSGAGGGAARPALRLDLSALSGSAHASSAFFSENDVTQKVDGHLEGSAMRVVGDPASGIGRSLAMGGGKRQHARPDKTRPVTARLPPKSQEP